MVLSGDQLIEDLRDQLRQKDRLIDLLTMEMLDLERRAVDAEVELLRIRRDLQRETVTW